MVIKQTYIVPALNEAVRFEAFAMQVVTEISSKKGIQKAIRRGELLLNGNKVSTGTWLKEGDRIDWMEKLEPFTPVEIDMPVVYEDDHLAVVNKPAGIVVSGNKQRTVLHALPLLLRKTERIDALPYPLPIHRLDYATSGLLVVAKTRSAHLHLSRQMESRSIEKQYQAIVCGKLSGKREFNAPIEEKKAITRFQVVKQIDSVKFKQLSLVQIDLLTGRTNQIRIHFSENGTPVLGDQKFGEEAHRIKGKGMFLCACWLRFMHPETQTAIELSISPPAKFDRVMAKV
ncbi:RluA family pseudouridine synthase [Prolixibacteraceae bacterium JC049]|nr:RluA family pseudouridine synthase [Prolixibacteraceae bacterium JC049]